MAKTILIVEDDYLDIVSVKRTLNKINTKYSYHVAHNGEEALAMLHGDGVKKIEKPDIILLDINMPKMNGIEFLQHLKRDSSFKNTPVFILTTSSEEFDKVRAEALGIKGYIIKPVDFDNYGNPASSIDNFNLLLELLK